MYFREKHKINLKYSNLRRSEIHIKVLKYAKIW